MATQMKKTRRAAALARFEADHKKYTDCIEAIQEKLDAAKKDKKNDQNIAQLKNDLAIFQDKLEKTTNNIHYIREKSLHL